MGWAIALHGGAGDIPRSLPPERRQPREAALRHCLQIGVDAIKAGRSPLDVVELVVRELEDNPHFNAGRGSVLTSNGTVEMEACIMDGNTKRCGAVSGLSTVKNAVSLARLVMEKTPHIYLGFDGAEAFARDQGVEIVDSSHLTTPENIERLKQAKEANRVQTAGRDATLSTKKGKARENASQDTDNLSVFSSRTSLSEKDREELIALRDQVEDLKRQLDEFFKSAELSMNEMASIHTRIAAFESETAEKDSLIKSTQLQLS